MRKICSVEHARVFRLNDIDIPVTEDPVSENSDI